MDNFSKDDNQLNMEVTSHYGQLISTDIRFFTSDRGTAVLNFMVTKNRLPMSISTNHAKANIVLKTENYNVETGAYVSDDLEIIDPINGKMQYVIPNEFLKYNGKVKAQIYFTQNGNGNVIVEREFGFQIDNDLISDFDGITKLTYIKSMQDLTESVADEVKAIKNSLSDAKTIVESIDTEFNKGIQQLEIKQNDAVQLITTTEQTAIDNLNSKIAEVEAKEKIVTDKIDNYESTIDDKSLLKIEDTANWQKYKITNDDGTIPNIVDMNISDVLNASKTSSVVHLTNAKDAPSIINIKDDEVLIDNPIEDGVPDDEDYEDYDEVQPDVNIQTANIIASGLLTTYIVDESVGRAFWRPDNTNEVFTTLKTNGTWLPFKKYNDEDITKEYIESTNLDTLNQSKQYIDQSIGNIGWQKHSLTDENGYSTKLDLAGSKDKMLTVASGSYYVINPPNLPTDILNAEGYMNVYVKDDVNKLYEFTPINSNKTLKRRVANGVLESAWFVTNEYKSDVLFDGSATGVGTELTLTNDYTKYSLLVVSGSYPGGAFTETALTSVPKSIIVSKTNLTDTDGSSAGLYEMIIQKLGNTTFRIGNDIYYDVNNKVGSGANANKFTISRIEGWK